MNFKRNLASIIVALTGVVALSSCQFNKLTKFQHYSVIEPIKDNEEDIVEAGYTKYKAYSNYDITVSGEKFELDSYEVFRDFAGANNIPSTGTQNIFVVPVQFPDYKVDKLFLTEEQYIENLNKAFFGCAKNNTYVSVGEYFNKSSYGKLKLDGMVCDKMFEFDLTTEEILENNIKRDELANKYYPEILKWLEANYPEQYEAYKVEGLEDGKNVPVYMVYTYPSINDEKDKQSFFWAYTFQNVPLSWSSSSLMYLQYGEPDSHTYIHECGHLLGLADYYPTTSRERANRLEDIIEQGPVTPEPTARIDMMDCSIGDETSFSKMYLNWTRPYFVNDSCTITINSFTESGDVILLSDSWNKTVFDEYYLIEFYTPTGLNTYDVSGGNDQAKLPKIPGVKIYHVDARLAFVDGNNIPNQYCEQGIEISSRKKVGFAHDNNTYGKPNIFQKNYLYSLILNHSDSMIADCAQEQNLYRYGDTISELKMNDGGTLNYKIEVLNAGFSNATVKIEKIA